MFSIDIASSSLKDVQQQMEFPFFSLSKKPDLEIRRYKDRDNNSLQITPSVMGMPTIYDKDFLIYAISQVMDRLNRGEEVSRRLILYASDMLEFANRTKSGRDYLAIEDALLRLSGCRIRTNIRTGDIYQTNIFGLVEQGDLIRKYGFNGRLQHVEVTLSEWLPSLRSSCGSPRLRTKSGIRPGAGPRAHTPDAHVPALPHRPCRMIL